MEPFSSGATLKKLVLACLIFAVAPTFVWARKGKSASCKQVFETIDEREKVTHEWLDRMRREAEQDSSEVQRLRQVSQHVGASRVALNFDVVNAHNPFYTHEIPHGQITNQASSGRCWIFAGCNVQRDLLLAQGKVDPSFEFSQNYLHFFNMIEKSNRFLTKVMKSEVDPSVTDMRQKLSPLRNIGDGGWFSYFQFLVAKYGMVPKSAMPETMSSLNTKLLQAELGERLGAIALELYKAKSEEADSEVLHALKEKGMRSVYKILVSHLGVPPVEFEFPFMTRAMAQGSLIIRPRQMVTFTPQVFAQKFVGFDPEEFVVVASVPFHAENRYYHSPDSNIGVAGEEDPRFDMKFLNVTAERLQELTVASLKRGQPVWFGADVARDIDHSRGIMHPRIFQTHPMYGLDEQDDHSLMLSRAAKLLLMLSGPNHAMVISGFDQPNAGEPVVKFKVENSWGGAAGDRGDYHMYAEWFREYVYQIIVPREVLSQSELEALKAVPQVLPEKNVF